MERQKTLWSEMTEEEQQSVRESWKHTLPEKFDVFCIGSLKETDSHLLIPGNLYVSNKTYVKDITVHENFFANHNVFCGKASILNNCFVDGRVACYAIDVQDLFDCYDVYSFATNISAADYVCRLYEE